MYGRVVGKYNVSYCGASYDGDVPYEMVIIEEFNGDIPVKGSKKTLYFRRNKGTDRTYILPDMRTEKEVEKWMQYKNYTRIGVRLQVQIETNVIYEPENYTMGQGKE